MDRFERFASREPYFTILTSPKFRRAQLTPEHEREFFESGERLVSFVFQLINDRLVEGFSPTAILEYGCGVGRLAVPLARRAAARGGTVTAVDRSEAMLAEARVVAARFGAGNISFMAPDEFQRAERRHDFIVCYLVLQRMPAARGLELMRDLVSRLAPGGIAVFLVPYTTTAPWTVRASRWLRSRFGPFNAAFNLARGRALDEPYVPSSTYELSRVMAALQEQTIGTTNVLLEPHEGLGEALLFVEAPMPAATRVRSKLEKIDVAELVQTTSIDELNRTAEEYFSALKDWDHHLAKPFAQIEEAPRLLGGVAVLLQGLDLTPGADVLEFGAGTGWLSRWLTQLGCRTFVLDVSPTALEIARETYARQPTVGDQPAPTFLRFDGRRIDLPDGSVDRVLCFHAFHHVPNPDDVIREFARVLRPGGIAGFAEPGPRHSRSSFSQFEMQTYKVVENDVDVHHVWRVAAGCGFSDIRMALFHSPPFHVSLREFEDFLAGGKATDAWTSATRVFMRDMRTFFLIKAGDPRADSRALDGLASDIHAVLSTAPRATGDPIVVDVTVSNMGRAVWLASDVVPGGVRVGAHLYDEAGALVEFDLPTAPLTDPPRAIQPRETVRCRLSVPPPKGRYTLEIDCVAARISWFAPLGSRPFRMTIDVDD